MHLGAFIGVLICYALVSLVDVQVPLFFKKFFDTISQGLAVIDGPTLSLNVLTKTLLLITALGALRWFSYRVAGFIITRLQSKVMWQILTDGFDYVIRHSYQFFTNMFVGSITKRINQLPRAYETVFDQFIFTLFPLVLSIVGILIVVFNRNTYVGLGLLLWVIVFLVVNAWIIKWRQPYEVRRAELSSKVSGVLSDSITNSITAKLFSGHGHEHSIFKDVSWEAAKAQLQSWNVSEWIRTVQNGLMLIIQLGLFMAAIWLWRRGLFTVGDFALIQLYLMTIFDRIFMFGHSLRMMYQAFADAQESISIMVEPYNVQDAPRALPIEVRDGNIEFKNVSFNFNETRSVLKDFSLAIAPHEKIAFVGPSGAGKTTVTKLLFRFYDVTSGEVLIDGQNIAHVTQESLRDAIALVPQDPILFHRSLKDNIRYGRRDATDEEVYEAAKKAHCHEFIMSLSEGYDTMVGERGVKLSGGERQRVAIARAILKNAPILVLDEATSSLDSESEHLIQDALHTLMEGKTVIVIAHRLSTVIKMDRIIVIENGDVRASGTHEQLLKKDTLYKKLWSIQAGGFLKDAD
ncbi:MAG: ABC transporter ATP-binding protein [Candidatus Pacebacteria bacterium]|nr:ABC transporter ATP-binding protein [Candidatus Paceibacterota bacterium]